ncbi:pyrroline-5-carboxylate reductase [Methanosalsum natronophilum]|nr:pyrroline-5-carboxylate reductase [Methanosalsum natronophilum]MCS3923505.1 pyrroline-5-carboxylate reductase [Methanosalsum natronophilum]
MAADIDINIDFKSKKIAFLGAGKMGEALIKGIVNSNLIPAQNICASDKYHPNLQNMGDELGINTDIDNKKVSLWADIIVLAIKPQALKPVLEEIKPAINDKKLVISIAAGVTTALIEDELARGSKVIRVMPNIAVTVSEGAAAICAGKNANEEDLKYAAGIFDSVGSSIITSEKNMDAVTGLSGSGPAFIFPIIEAMADGAVHEGLDRENALKLATQTVLGAAQLMMTTKKHPGELKDMVTSPGGTTIRGLQKLEENKVRFAFMDAVITSARRSKELGK